MEFVKTWLISLFAVLVLVACGGGGGLAGGDGVATGPSLEITEDNAAQVTSVVVGSADPGTEFLVDQIDWFGSAGNQELVNNIPGVIISLPPEDCLVDGTFTLSGVVDNEISVTPGDSLSIGFDGCDDGLGAVLNGELELTMGSFSPVDLNFLNPIPPYIIPVTLGLTDFSVKGGGQVLIGNGDMMLELATENGNVVTVTLQGDSLVSEVTDIVIANTETTTLSGYLYQVTENLVSPFNYSIEMSGKQDSTAIGGSVMFETTTAFSGFESGNPEAGVLLITGANDSQCRLTVIDLLSVKIEVDADGDGDFETTIDGLSWDSLSS